MKKLKSVFAFIVIGALLTGCAGDDDSNPINVSGCETAAANTAVAAQAFTNATDATFPQACAAYKVALQAQITSCGDASGALQATIDDLGDCTITSNPDPSGGSITVTVGGPRVFDTNISVTVNGSSRTIYAEQANTTNTISITVANSVTGAAAVTAFSIHIGTSDYTPLAVDEGGNFTSNITVNSQTNVTGTFYGYVTSPTTGADLDLTSGMIDIDL